MSSRPISRRDILRGTATWAGATLIGAGIGTGPARAAGFRSANDRPRMAALGTGSRWSQKATGINGPHGAAQGMVPFGDYVAVCDADGNRRGWAADLVKEWCGKTPEVNADYRAIIDRKDIDIIHISTPDHWHAKMAIEAMRSGKDVYCEKPMTLTIEEGQLMVETTRKTGRIVQIGTQQRSSKEFIQAIGLIRDGRIGDIKKATCVINGAPSSPEVPVADAPAELDWNLWLGPAPYAPYRFLAGDNGETKSWSRSHYEFRWWYEYSGGKLTDWGAHHVDIATWAMGKTDTGPVSIDPVMVKHPVEFKDGYPTDDAHYNTATEFLISAKFADGQEIEIRHDGDNGILFEGTKGTLIVSRGSIKGQAVDDLATNPLPEGAMEKVYKNRPLTGHYQNFFECVASRQEPISDVFSHHRALSTCHLAGIAARVGRPIQWDPTRELVINDTQAQGLVARGRRKGFEIEV